MQYKTIMIRFVFFVFLMVSIKGSAMAITLTASPNPAAMGQTVTFKIDVSKPSGSANYFIMFGDSRSALALGSYSGDQTITVTHTYDQAGVYTVQAYADDPDVVTPNPGLLSVRVSDFQITRLETFFDNQRPEITIKQREPVPALYTKINFTGAGFLKGYWEVDGFKRNYVFRRLSIGPEITLKYPDALPLSSFTPGSHIVRFVITQPYLDISFPKAVYFVTAEEYKAVFPIRFLMPENKAVLKYQPFEFKWETVPSAALYLVFIFQEGRPAPVYSAYSKQGNYHLRPQTLSELMVPGKAYRFQVKGFDRQARLVAQSKIIGVQFEK